MSRGTLGATATAKSHRCDADDHWLQSDACELPRERDRVLLADATASARTRCRIYADVMQSAASVRAQR